MKPFTDWPETMTAPEVVEYTGINKKDVYRMFKFPDFPQLIKGKRADRRVGKYALRVWLNKGVKTI